MENWLQVMACCSDSSAPLGILHSSFGHLSKRCKQVRTRSHRFFSVCSIISVCCTHLSPTSGSPRAST